MRGRKWSWGVSDSPRFTGCPLEVNLCREAHFSTIWSQKKRCPGALQPGGQAGHERKSVHTKLWANHVGGKGDESLRKEGPGRTT